MVCLGVGLPAQREFPALDTRASDGQAVCAACSVSSEQGAPTVANGASSLQQRIGE